MSLEYSLIDGGPLQLKVVKLPDPTDSQPIAYLYARSAFNFEDKSQPNPYKFQVFWFSFELIIVDIWLNLDKGFDWKGSVSKML